MIAHGSAAGMRFNKIRMILVSQLLFLRISTPDAIA